MDWRDDAACIQIGPDLFYPSAGGGSVHSYTAGRSICLRCPVITPCLEFALAMEATEGSGIRCGMWGGTTPHERAKIANQRKGADRVA